MEQLVFKTEIYEGPLDLLLSLIAKNKMNICDIKISVIFEQYMDYINTLRELDMDIAGEFIQMASELMLIKSKMLLPQKDEDPREELVRTLMEYKTAKEAAEKLSVLEKEYFGRFEKDTDEIMPDKTVIDDIDVALLSKALSRVLVTMSEKEQLAKTKPIEAINPIIKKKIVSVPSRIIHLIRFMYARTAVHFDELFDDCTSRSSIIATFYALLELLKAGRIIMHKIEGDETNSNVILSFNKEKLRNTDNG